LPPPPGVSWGRVRIDIFTREARVLVRLPSGPRGETVFVILALNAERPRAAFHGRLKVAVRRWAVRRHV
jgi:hypothetical protein